MTPRRSHPGRNFDVEKRYSSVPSTEYRSVQPARIVCDLNHDRPLGEVKYLERTDRNLYAVCEIDGSTLGDGLWYFSPLIRHYGGRDIELQALAICKTPASVALGQISAFPGSFRDAARKIVYQDGHLGQLVKRADEYNQRRKYGEPLVIKDVHPQRPAPVLVLASSSRRVEIRSAAAVDVHRARRELDLVIAPAETPTTIHERTRS